MEIQRAKEEHIDGMIQLLYQVNQVHADGRPDLFKDGGIKYTKEDLKNKINNENETIFVAVEDGKVEGYIFGFDDDMKESGSTYPVKTFYIDDFCVDESSRGKGIGTKLYGYVKEYAKQKKYDRITLHVWECNPNAKRFYEYLGMKPMYVSMEDIW